MAERQAADSPGRWTFNKNDPHFPPINADCDQKEQLGDRVGYGVGVRRGEGRCISSSFSELGKVSMLT